MQPPVLFVPNSLKTSSSVGVSVHEFNSLGITPVSEDPEDQVFHAYTHFQHITTEPSKNWDFKNSIEYNRSTSGDTFEGVTESGKDLKLKNDFRVAVNEFGSVKSVTTVADYIHEKESSSTSKLPEHEESAPTESLLSAGDSHLQSHSEEVYATDSVDTIAELLHDKQNYTVGEDHDAEMHLSTASSVVESSTSETLPLHSTNIASNFDEEHIPVHVGADTRRSERSVPVEAMLRNSFVPHRNTSYDIMETHVDWGGVSSNYFKYSGEKFYLRKIRKSPVILWGHWESNFRYNKE